MTNLKKILLCGSAAIMAAPMSALAGGKPSALITQEQRLDNLCRDTGTNADCLAREKLYYRINNMGWCYGKENQGAPQYQWHHCGPDSIRSTKESIHQYE